jgi:predicted Rossmann-fold nucleotide-binding protein
MDAANQGALEADKPVGGFKIGKEAGEWTTSNFHPYLPSESYHTCRYLNLETMWCKVLRFIIGMRVAHRGYLYFRFFSARKHGLVDAVVRNDATVKTAIVALPGGIGTLDEVFEIMALIQLERIGSTLPVPFLLMNYDFYYSKLLEFLDDCKDWGTVAPGKVASLWKVCNGNYDALEYLAQFYNVPAGERNYDISPLSKEHRSPPYTIPR